MSQMIQSYELLEPLGYGGMAKVIKVRHEITGKFRAMKILYEQYAIDPQMEVRFKEEAIHAGKLNHPNIVKVYEYIKDGANLCIIMEFIDGKPLSKIIGSEVGPIVPAKAIPLFIQIAQAIDHGHRLPLPLIHRDIKPSNVLITSDGIAKVTDFGIAKALGGVSHTATGTMLGTLEYMSPEQMLGKDVDQRSDIYSLGITLYEMLAGRLPFSFRANDSMIEKIRIINESSIPDPREFYPFIPEYLVNIIRKAIQKDKSKRFQSVGEFIGAIERENFAGSSSLENFAPTGSGGIRTSFQPSDETTSKYGQTVAEVREEIKQEAEDEEEGSSAWYYILIIFLIAVIGTLGYIITTLIKK
jgi:serine/threonine-protein kinase